MAQQSPRYKAGQIVYWQMYCIMRAEVLEVIDRKFRTPKYRVKWIDENDRISVHKEHYLTASSIYWKDDGTPEKWWVIVE
ncbi:hypothetical protein HUN41_00195 [Streptomyces phage Coruscant]|uniref:Uncharacterized protein n=1 Tax=Streptomyces phage Coruscant TaxID=2739834 RepID=A0A7G4AW98_9CAUD|nr:hypothetical protein PP454_gp129 [Streptomyces phage Coruscant]QMP84288.1 hypothetical protein HUN41_00195 [Streptomyces phage Coruscant]